jgi:hypothetical protein
MAEPAAALFQASEWFTLYRKVLLASQEGLLSAIQTASLAMSERLRNLDRKESRERKDILTGLGDLYVLRASASRARSAKRPEAQ